MRVVYNLMGLMMASSSTLWAAAPSATVPLKSGDAAPVRMANVTQAKVPTATYSTEQAARLIEDYFNGFTTMTAWFSQHSSSEQWTHEGTLVVEKPSKLVWKYETPHRQRIISTGSAVYYVDDEGGQVTQLPMQGGIARLIGAREVKLDKLGFKVTKVRQEGAQLDVTINPTKPDNQVQSITLGFNTAGVKPVLNAINVVDALNSVTQVQLSNVQAGVKVDPKVFKFTPPQYQQN